MIGLHRVLRQSALLLSGAVAVSHPGWAQVSDTTPPRLLSLSISPVSVNVSAAASPVTVTMRLTDDLSGVSSVCMVFTGASGQRTDIQCGNRTSGTALDGTYVATFQIPRYSAAGIWNLDQFDLRDNAGNRPFFTTANLQTRGFTTVLSVASSPSDTQPPRVTSLSIAAPTSDLRDAPGNLTITMGLSDDLAGLDFTRFIGVSMVLTSPSTRQYQYLGRQDFRLQPGGNSLSGIYQIALTMPRYSEAGAWSISSVLLVDHVGNEAQLTAAALRSQGFNPTFTVLSSQPDSEAPQLTRMTFEPSVIDTSAGPRTVNVTMDITDNLAGADFSPDNAGVSTSHGIYFSSPSGQQFQQCCFFPPTFSLVSGTVTNGRWTAPVVFPQFSEAGTWNARVLSLKDAAHNQVALSPSDLQLRGLPYQLTIFRPSTTVDGSVGTGGGIVQDQTFGSRASVRVPPGAVAVNTTVAVDVLTDPPPLPAPSGYSAGTFFESIILTPTPSFPLAPPGLTVVLPMPTFTTPGTQLDLYRFDPGTGTLVPAVSDTGTNVRGTVDAGGTSATFAHVAHLSTVVAFAPNSHVLGDVNGDRKVDCADLLIVKAALGKTSRDPGFDARADVNNDGAVNILDFAIVARQLPAGTACN